jgi:hypothetical protein
VVILSIYIMMPWSELQMLRSEQEQETFQIVVCKVLMMTDHSQDGEDGWMHVFIVVNQLLCGDLNVPDLHSVSLLLVQISYQNCYTAQHAPQRRKDGRKATKIMYKSSSIE